MLTSSQRLAPHQIRNSNLEIRNKFKTRSTKPERSSLFLAFDFSNSEVVSDFEIRISDFAFRQSARALYCSWLVLRVDGIFHAAYDGREPREPWPTRPSN